METFLTVMIFQSSSASGPRDVSKTNKEVKKFNAHTCHILSANYIHKEFIISFDSDGGSNVSSVSRVYNSEIGNLPNPEKENHKFKCWKLGEECLKEERMPGYDINLVAKWETSSSSTLILNAFVMIITLAFVLF